MGCGAGHRQVRDGFSGCCHRNAKGSGSQYHGCRTIATRAGIGHHSIAYLVATRTQPCELCRASGPLSIVRNANAASCPDPLMEAAHTSSWFGQVPPSQPSCCRRYLSHAISGCKHSGKRPQQEASIRLVRWDHISPILRAAACPNSPRTHFLIGSVAQVQQGMDPHPRLHL